MKKIVMVLALIVLLPLIGWCGGGGENDVKEEVVCWPEATTPAEYGTRVYYIPCTGHVFAEILDLWLFDTGHEVEAISGDGNGIYGRDSGYFIVVAATGTLDEKGSEQ